MNTELATLTTQTIGLTNKLATMTKDLNRFLADFKKSGSSADKWLYQHTQETIHKYELALWEKNAKILKIINNDTIYQPPAVFLTSPLPADLLNDIKTRNYYNCKPNHFTRMWGEFKWCGNPDNCIKLCPISYRLKENEKWQKNHGCPYDPNDQLWDEEGFFHNYDDNEHPNISGGTGKLYFERKGIEILDLTIRKLLVRGNNPTKILFNFATSDYDDQDHTKAKDIRWAKRILKMNNVKGRSKATTLEKAVKLLMSI